MILYPLRNPLTDETEGGSQTTSRDSDDEEEHVRDWGPWEGTVNTTIETNV